MWWLKTGSTWIEPTISDLGAPRVIPIRKHTRKDTFEVWSTGDGVDLRPSGLKLVGGIVRRTGIEKLSVWSKGALAQV